MVEKESARIVHNRVGGAVHAHLVTDDSLPIPLTFFKDGVKLGSFDFQSHDLASAQQLIRDIMDGYFPYALKEDYPDGVAMKVVDRTSHEFSDWLCSRSHGDPELLDGGNRLAPLGGRVLHPRSAVGEEANSRHIEKAGKDNQIPEVDLLVTDRDPRSQSTRLQVKMESGERVVFHMEPHHSIGNLEDALDRWRLDHGLPGLGANERQFQLRTAFPPKVHSDRVQTLQEACLVPSATLFVGIAQGCEI
jgi:hypothetical protein